MLCANEQPRVSDFESPVLSPCLFGIFVPGCWLIVAPHSLHKLKIPSSQDSIYPWSNSERDMLGQSDRPSSTSMLWSGQSSFWIKVLTGSGHEFPVQQIFVAAQWLCWTVQPFHEMLQESWQNQRWRVLNHWVHSLVEANPGWGRLEQMHPSMDALNTLERHSISLATYKGSIFFFNLSFCPFSSQINNIRSSL